MAFSAPLNARPLRLLLRAGLPQRSRHFHAFIAPLPSRIARPLYHRRYPSGLRFASTSREAATDTKSLVTRIQNLVLGTSIGLSFALGLYYITDTRAAVHHWLLAPLLRWTYDDAEVAHEVAVKVLKGLYDFGLHPRDRGVDGGDLEVVVFGHRLTNPIGISAGLDKNADIPSPLFALGASIVEVGGVTPLPQEGNPKPRVFRVPSQNALVNRYGLNSQGADDMAIRLRQRAREYAYASGFGIGEDAEQRVLDGEAGVPPGSLVEGKLLAVQVAKNKLTPDDDIEAVKADYVYCVEALARYADIIVVNVSSPNTPGLRAFQSADLLTDILTGVVEATKKVNRKKRPAVMVKVSPDEDSDEQVSGICDAISASDIDGVIVSNTTTRRPDPFPLGCRLSTREAAVMAEQGGYSGPQLFNRTKALVERYRKTLDDSVYSKPQSLHSPHSTSGTANLSESAEEISPKVDVNSQRINQLVTTVEQELKHFNDPTVSAGIEAESQPLFRQPSYNIPSSDTSNPDSSASSVSAQLDQLSPSQPSTIPNPTILPSSSNTSSPGLGVEAPKRKVIFASGGITNGTQALAVLEAGAQVAMLYTAFVYGGVGTISSVKQELEEELSNVTREEREESDV